MDPMQRAVNLLHKRRAISLPHLREWRNGSRTGLKIPGLKYDVWVRIPPPACTCGEIGRRNRLKPYVSEMEVKVQIFSGVCSNGGIWHTRQSKVLVFVGSSPTSSIKETRSLTVYFVSTNGYVY